MLYYLLPDCNHILKSINIKLKFKVNDEDADIYLSKSIHKYLNNSKELIDQNYKKWDIIKKYTNPYEFIHSNLPHMNYAISKVKPVSRAFFKLIEIYKHFNILSNYTSLKSFHLAEGPGGFIEATAFMRSNPLDTYYGITLTNDDDYSIPGWRKSQQLFKNYKNIIIEKGKTGNGNLYNVENYKHMASMYKNSMNIITADGGFDFSGTLISRKIMRFLCYTSGICYCDAEIQWCFYLKNI